MWIPLAPVMKALRWSFKGFYQIYVTCVCVLLEDFGGFRTLVLKQLLCFQLPVIDLVIRKCLLVSCNLSPNLFGESELNLYFTSLSFGFNVWTVLKTATALQVKHNILEGQFEILPCAKHNWHLPFVSQTLHFVLLETHRTLSAVNNSFIQVFRLLQLILPVTWYVWEI